MTSSAIPNGLSNSASPLVFGLLGSPNAGKTTLFNALTGLRAKVGNYPGVTVERREGEVSLGRGDSRALLIDLPGTYGLTPISADEAVVNDVLSGSAVGVARPDALILVADACSLSRSLPFIGQAISLGMQTCVVLTMLDELAARGGSLDIQRLEASLGVPVVGVVGHRGRGIDALRQLLGDPAGWSRPAIDAPQDRAERTGWANSIAENVITQRPARHQLTERVDRVVLHPVWGSLLFLAVMVLFFQLIFTWASPAMDAIDGLITALASLARDALPAGWIADLVADGLVAGVGSVVIFLPQIIILFALLYLLEDLGYMARAAFVVDRLMGRIGLEGRSFVALLSSYACAVPGIMATRTIPSPRDRLVTILVAPLMTCSARLPVYALLISAFVPERSVWGPIGLQGLILLGLYVAGAVAALIVAALFKKTLIRGDGLPFTMELPTYRWPTGRVWLSQVVGSAWAFIRRAGTIILAASIILWVLLNFPKVEIPAHLDESAASAYALEYSAAGRIGHAIEPAIAPLGFDWKIGVGLIASLAAREILVATLAQVYATDGEEGESLREALRNDRDPETGNLVFTPATVGALLVFFVFALQCTSTLAIMRRETNSWRWPAFAFAYLFVLAYTASFVTHRVITALGGTDWVS
ncbi:MAG: ferrous iron transporter B [Myxococcales bacterium]|nr:ferrous iron transporter B [Myxococcales bacterium]HIK85759.1 ferrous iron transporter B [Myxococcales bacterium]